MDSTEINPYDTLHLTILANDDKPCARTVLQKLIYFCCKYITGIEDVGFKPHHYGPYSAKLSMVLEEMVSCGFIDEGVKPGPIYDRYNYRLSDRGKKLVSKIKDNSGDKYEQINRVVDVCNKMTGLQAKKLSYAAKVHYISKELNGNSDEEIISIANKHDWEMGEGDVKEGRNLIMKLDSRS